jgi:elongation factor Ts
MAISAKDVMTLRKKSGLGMMECKQALTETDGDMAAAEQQLREKGLSKMDGRTDRASAEGRIAVALGDDESAAAIIEVNTETDFTAGNDQFKSMADKLAAMALEQSPGEAEKSDAMQTVIDEVRLTTKENVQFSRGAVRGAQGHKVGTYVHHNGKIGALVEVDGQVDTQLLRDLCMHVVSINPVPQGISDEDIPADVVEKERATFKAQAIESGKPEEIAEKMVTGRMRKFYEENALLKQAFVKDDKKQIKDILPEGITITSFVRFALGEVASSE